MRLSIFSGVVSKESKPLTGALEFVDGGNKATYLIFFIEIHRLAGKTRPSTVHIHVSRAPLCLAKELDPSKPSKDWDTEPRTSRRFPS